MKPCLIRAKYEAVRQAYGFPIREQGRNSNATTALQSCGKRKASSHLFNTAKLASAEKKPKMDLSGVKPGVAVIHKKFGDGSVMKIAGDKIYIAFGKAEKVFLFPSSFENGFLRVK